MSYFVLPNGEKLEAVRWSSDDGKSRGLVFAVDCDDMMEGPTRVLGLDPVKGGQGRSDDSVEKEAIGVLKLAVIAVLVIFLGAVVSLYRAHGAEEDAVVRVNTTRTEKNGDVITAWGNGIAIDKHRVVTCWHCVKDGSPSIHLDAKDVACELVACDPDMDLAVLEVQPGLKHCAKLCGVDPTIKDEVWMIGSARDDSVIRKIKSTVTKAPGFGRFLWDISTHNFDQGCSGSGVFFSGRLYGLVCGGDPRGKGVRSDTAAFVPAKRIFHLIAALDAERAAIVELPKK